MNKALTMRDLAFMEAVELRKSGHPVSQIAKEVGLSRDVLGRHFAKLPDLPRKVIHRQRGPNDFDASADGTVALRLPRGFVTIVDQADFDAIRHRPWNVDFRPRSPRKLYVYTPAGSHSRIWLHRVILGVGEGEFCDHIDRDTLNNRRSNLRIASIAENNINRGQTLGRSGFRGVYERRRRGRVRFEAIVRVGGERHFVGCFGSPEDAARAYDLAALRLHRAFAVLNFPEAAQC